MLFRHSDHLPKSLVHLYFFKFYVIFHHVGHLQQIVCVYHCGLKTCLQVLEIKLFHLLCMNKNSIGITVETSFLSGKLISSFVLNFSSIIRIDFPWSCLCFSKLVIHGEGKICSSSSLEIFLGTNVQLGSTHSVNIQENYFSIL